MPNIDLVCVECKKPFFFNEADQAFYKERGFNTPKRCYACRKARKQGKGIESQPVLTAHESEDYTGTWDVDGNTISQRNGNKSHSNR